MYKCPLMSLIDLSMLSSVCPWCKPKYFSSDPYTRTCSQSELQTMFYGHLCRNNVIHAWTSWYLSWQVLVNTLFDLSFIHQSSSLTESNIALANVQSIRCGIGIRNRGSSGISGLSKLWISDINAFTQNLNKLKQFQSYIIMKTVKRLGFRGRKSSPEVFQL